MLHSAQGCPLSGLQCGSPCIRAGFWPGSLLLSGCPPKEPWTDRQMGGQTHRAVVVVLTPQEGRLGNSVHNAWYKMPLGQARSLRGRRGHYPAGLGAGERQRAWFSGSRGRAHAELMPAQLPRDRRHFRGRGSCLIRCPSGLLSGSEPGIQPGFPPSACLPSTTWHHVCPLPCIWIVA